ncbi:hypothetical protein [Rhodanobacter sp. DHG33]|uniref:hypothetical protein n=1 Tax=Rhodanobacter sp. DHG33 TaxID=2775921 RepID=UPI00177B9CE0|nr:hypothetical protein [Rhodanobacter sp. DHG33]MBD8897663.1 hypothetical protein [Rhodanobacter sp. DHG33]
MKRQALIAVMTIVSFSVAGCGGSQQSGRQASASDSGGASVQKGARATLTVTPSGVSTCNAGAHVNPEVTWQRIDVAIKNTKVTVSTPGSSDEKLFATGGFGGSAKAGDWVVPGVTFHLYDADTGGVLASYTEAALPCNN